MTPIVAPIAMPMTSPFVGLCGADVSAVGVLGDEELVLSGVVVEAVREGMPLVVLDEGLDEDTYVGRSDGDSEDKEKATAVLTEELDKGGEPITELVGEL